MKEDSIKGDIIMCDINSIDAEILTLMAYTPYIYDNNKKVLFAVDKKGLKIFYRFKKIIERNNHGKV